MKKMIAILVTFLGTMAAVADTSDNSYFLWSFQTGTSGNPVWPNVFSAAALYATLQAGGEDALIFNVDPLSKDSFAYVDASIGSSTPPINILANLGTDPSIYASFYLVAYSETGELEILPTAVDYAAIQDYVYTDMGTAIDGNAPYVFSVIPEPTSGLLLLFGLAGLALRRRRV